MPAPSSRQRDPRTRLCAICRESLHPEEDLVVTPDFLADESDPFWPFSDAAMHRSCFLLWDRRKRFVARFNRAARGWVVDGYCQHMTGEGDVVSRQA